MYMPRFLNKLSSSLYLTLLFMKGIQIHASVLLRTTVAAMRLMVMMVVVVSIGNSYENEDDKGADGEWYM